MTRAVNKGIGDWHVRVVPQGDTVDVQFKLGNRIFDRLEVSLDDWPATPYERMRYLRKLARVEHPYLMAGHPLLERRLDAARRGIAELTGN